MRRVRPAAWSPSSADETFTAPSSSTRRTATGSGSRWCAWASPCTDRGSPSPTSPRDLYYTVCLQPLALGVPPDLQWLAFLSTTQTTFRCRSLAQSRQPRLLRGHAALHRPDPSRARAGHGLPGLSLSGSGRLGVPVPTRLMPTRIPSPVTSLLGSGRLGLPADRRLGPTRIPASSHVT